MLTVIYIRLISDVLCSHAFAQVAGLRRGWVMRGKTSHAFLLGLNNLLQLREQLAAVHLRVGLFLL